MKRAHSAAVVLGGTVLVMNRIPASDDERRSRLYEGALLALPATDTSTAFAAFTARMVAEAFDPLDVDSAQEQLAVEDFVAVVAELKPRFTHAPEAKELLRDMLVSYGCEPAETYFDVPKLRIVTHSNYLTTGVGYAYTAHRDVWYSCPPGQNNWWMPVSEILPECSLAFYPQWWERPAANSSGGFDAFAWNATGRATAAQHIGTDPRNHPRVTIQLDLGEEVRIVGAPGSLLCFSAAQLHATVPNTSGRVRVSVDFRTAHIDDLRKRRGAAIVDSASTGSTIYDFYRLDGLGPVPNDVAAIYDAGGERKGPKTFSPIGME